MLKCIPPSELCYPKKNLTTLLTSMNNGWLMVLSNNNKKLSEINQLHSVMPSRIDSNPLLKIMLISAK